MVARNPGASPTPGFTPLAPLLRSVDPIKLDEARRRLRSLERAELIGRYRAAFAAGRRLAGYLTAGALVIQGVPPFAWHDALHVDGLTTTERFDLFMGDLLWLRHQYPDHATNVRYQRCRAILNGGTAVFHREAEFMWYGGRRPAWKLVGSLSLTERQQWDCTLLRSTPIKKRAALTEAMRERSLQALQDDVQSVRRTVTYGEAEAQATVQRRCALWHCMRMVRANSPTETAARYEQLTGTPITRQAAAQQLEKVRAVLAKIEMAS